MKNKINCFGTFTANKKTQEKGKGYRPVGLGYPMIHLQQEEATQIMPVFIWPLRLEPSLYRVNEWEVYASNPGPCRVNPRLLQWLRQNEVDHNLSDVSPYPGAKRTRTGYTNALFKSKPR